MPHPRVFIHFHITPNVAPVFISHLEKLCFFITPNVAPVLISHLIRPLVFIICLSPGDFFLSHLFLISLFLHALVIGISRTYHTNAKRSFIISHVRWGTWKMAHYHNAFIVNITPEAEVLLKYRTYGYLPLFSP